MPGYVDPNHKRMFLVRRTKLRSYQSLYGHIGHDDLLYLAEKRGLMLTDVARSSSTWWQIALRWRLAIHHQNDKLYLYIGCTEAQLLGFILQRRLLDESSMNQSKHKYIEVLLAADANATFNLANLPLELRLIVYRLCLADAKPGKGQPALTKVSKSLRLEALPVFYNLHGFGLYLYLPKTNPKRGESTILLAPEADAITMLFPSSQRWVRNTNKSYFHMIEKLRVIIKTGNDSTPNYIVYFSLRLVQDGWGITNIVFNLVRPEEIKSFEERSSREPMLDGVVKELAMQKQPSQEGLCRLIFLAARAYKAFHSEGRV